MAAGRRRGGSSQGLWSASTTRQARAPGHSSQGRSLCSLAQRSALPGACQDTGWGGAMNFKSVLLGPLSSTSGPVWKPAAHTSGRGVYQAGRQRAGCVAET